MRRCLRSAPIFDVKALSFGQLGIFVWIAIDPPEKQKVGQTDGPGESEAPAPTGMDKNDADDGDSDGRGEFGCGIVKRGGEAALALGEPEADGFRIRRKGWRFAYAEQEARAKERIQIGRGCCGKRGGAPDEGAYAPHASDAELVEYHADGQLAKRVGPVIGARKITKDDVRDAEGCDQRIMRNGQIDAVKKVDQDANTEQPCDAPPAAREASGLRRV